MVFELLKWKKVIISVVNFYYSTCSYLFFFLVFLWNVYNLSFYFYVFLFLFFNWFSFSSCFCLSHFVWLCICFCFRPTNCFTERAIDSLQTSSEFSFSCVLAFILATDYWLKLFRFSMATLPQLSPGLKRRVSESPTRT